jgi:hypothetical protein
LKVFISWSGRETKSFAVAEALNSWLPTVINAVEPWISSEGLRAGLKWNQQLERELDDTSFGIIVVTPWNQGSQWINFEAGALSKRVGGADSRVAPLLIDFEKTTDLAGPLASYQATVPTKESIQALVLSINEALGDADPRPRQLLESAFDICWPAFDAELKRINSEFPVESDPTKAPHPAPVINTQEDALAEILASVRELTRSSANLHSDFAAGINESLAHRPATISAGQKIHFLKEQEADVLKFLRKYTKVSLGIYDNEVRVRTDGPLPQDVKSWAKGVLSGLYSGYRVVFKEGSLRDLSDEEESSRLDSS